MIDHYCQVISSGRNPLFIEAWGRTANIVIKDEYEEFVS